MTLNRHDGREWRFRDLGRPPGATLTGRTPPSAITYQDSSGRQRIYVFVSAIVDGRSRLFVCYVDNIHPDFTWADLGMPREGVGVGLVSAIPPVPEIPNGINCFCVGSDNQLYTCFWDESMGRWPWDTTLTNPGTEIKGPSAILFEGRPYVFCRGRNNHVYVKFWNKERWAWDDRGYPEEDLARAYPPMEAPPQPVAVTKSGEIYIFVQGVYGNGASPSPSGLYYMQWNGMRWDTSWTNLGPPTGSGYRSAAIAFNEAGIIRPYVFLKGTNNLLVQWVDQARKWRYSDLGPF